MYAYTQDVPIDLDTYRRIIDALGPEPLAGSLLQVCARRPDGGLRDIEIWDSEAACIRVLDERIHPAVDKAFGGVRPNGEPKVEHLEVLHANRSLLAHTEHVKVVAELVY